MVREARLLQILKIGFLSAQDEFQVKVVVELTIHGTLQSNVRVEFEPWTARVPSYVLELLVASDFDPAAGPQRLSHYRIANDHAEVFFALLRHEGLVKRSWFRCLRTRELFHFITVVTVTVKSFIDASIIVLSAIHDVTPG